MKVVLLLAVVGVALVAANPYDENFKPTFEHVGILSDEEIDYINKVQSSWKAGRNFDPSYASVVKGWTGVDMKAEEKYLQSLPIKQYTMDDGAIPDHFDPRDKWTNCSSLNEIRDQGNCHSGYVFGPVQAMTDRICIASNGKKNVQLSAENVMTCSDFVVDRKKQDIGCVGGSSSMVWNYYHHKGIVTGGPYDSHQGCQPYQIKPCDHHISVHLTPCHGFYKYPNCYKYCQPYYNKTYPEDLHYGKFPYRLRYEYNIKRDLYNYGPVQSWFFLNSDFLHYKSGVYKHTSGVRLGVHAVKIMGWGVENGEKYWLVANSWNKDWGDKGFFKILRGVNECNIEFNMQAAEPIL